MLKILVLLNFYLPRQIIFNTGPMSKTVSNATTCWTESLTGTQYNKCAAQLQHLQHACDVGACSTCTSWYLSSLQHTCSACCLSNTSFLAPLFLCRVHIHWFAPKIVLEHATPSFSLMHCRLLSRPQSVKVGGLFDEAEEADLHASHRT